MGVSMSANVAGKALPTKARRIAIAKAELDIADSLLFVVEREFREEQFKASLGMPSTPHRKGLIRDAMRELRELRYQRLLDAEAGE